MNNKEIREKAIKRYKNSKSHNKIYQSLGKSKTCFFKWLKRYKLNGEVCAKSHSHYHQSSKRIDKIIEQTVIETRKHLEKMLYSQMRDRATSYDLNKQGLFHLVSIVNIILRRNNLVYKRTKYSPKGGVNPSN